MSSIMEPQQGVRQGRRRAEKDPQQGTSEGKSLSKERLRTRLTDILWSGWLKLLLLLCFIDSIGSAPVGNTPRHVTGEKGGTATLPCEFEARDIIDSILSRQSKKILVSKDEKFGRVFKKGACDIIIKDLRPSDAGKYILSVYINDQGEVEREYHLHIQDEISVKTGEQLKMDVLLSNADKVEKNSSEGWKEVWTRGHGVSSDRLTDRDGNLTISNFTVTDTGTYRVLDSNNETLITVTVTGPSKELVGKRDTDKTDQHKSWIIAVSVIGALALVMVISALIWKYKCQHKSTEHVSVPMEDTEL